MTKDVQEGTVLLGAYVPRELASSLALTCAALGQRKSELIRQALQEFLQRQPDDFEKRLADRIVAEFNLGLANQACEDSPQGRAEFCAKKRQELEANGVLGEKVKAIDKAVRKRL